MIRAEIFYNKATDKIEYTFPSFNEVRPDNTNLIETFLIDTDSTIIDSKVIRSIKRYVREIDSKCRLPNNQVIWKISPTGMMCNDSKTLRKIRFLNRNASLFEPNIIYTERFSGSTISFMVYGRTVKRLSYNQKKDIETAYSSFVLKNKDILAKYWLVENITIWPFDADEHLTHKDVLNYF